MRGKAVRTRFTYCHQWNTLFSFVSSCGVKDGGTEQRLGSHQIRRCCSNAAAKTNNEDSSGDWSWSRFNFLWSLQLVTNRISRWSDTLSTTSHLTGRPTVDPGDGTHAQQLHNPVRFRHSVGFGVNADQHFGIKRLCTMMPVACGRSVLAQRKALNLNRRGTYLKPARGQR